jgi:hypothetical protein
MEEKNHADHQEEGQKKPGKPLGRGLGDAPGRAYVADKVLAKGALEGFKFYFFRRRPSFFSLAQQLGPQLSVAPVGPHLHRPNGYF